MDASDISFVVMTTDVFGHDLTGMKEEIPGLAVLVDHEHDAMKNFLRSLNYTERPCVHLEDDIIMCDNFYERITGIICQHSEDVIQFFSPWKKDVTIGTRYMAGREFLFTLCFYLPAGVGPKIAEYIEGHKRRHDFGAPWDFIMADYFKEHKIKYLNWCPNLVDHKVCTSRIDTKRSRYRVSTSFKQHQ
ncbi:MAG: hypothetical protein LUE27_04370 [Clostridia bacterium]|nr:hypothetical protein [Clostridia bacterium]